ncbi:uncharacterized protein [Rutidosis leptorrhynchoides]|uniref:uncharacterized protein n=1 Tax=Rutidosis leptorrhynchoides TaxID=125765 RepID=UPI003A99CFA0
MEKVVQAFKAPPKLANKGKLRDTNKFCDFHNNYGHETDECIQLKLAIEDATTKTHEPVVKDKKPNAGKAILAIESCFAVESRRHFKRSRPHQVIDWEEISFPALDTITPSDQLVTISGMIFDRDVHRIYLDSGSSCDVMYEHCFQQLSPAIKARLMPPRVPLVGFSGERCWTIGEIELDFTIKEPSMTRTETLDFVFVRENS